MKRGASGLSLVLGIDKPSSITSHDVVNQVRKCFNEKRVGHTGTLDPLASGVLPILVGPATKLSNYLMGHDKSYRVEIKFGEGTTTDDSEGEVIRTSSIPGKLIDAKFAETFLSTLVGKQKQLPPSYSAIKVNGKKAYSEARKGNVINLEARDIEIYSAELVEVVNHNYPEALSWVVDFHVSKGTYIRSIARDIGFALECPAHVSKLRRLSVGNLDTIDCVGLQTLQEVGIKAALDPVKLLDFKFIFADDSLKTRVDNGRSIPIDIPELYKYKDIKTNICACTSGIIKVCSPLKDGELISVVSQNTLKAIYAYDTNSSLLKPVSVFQIGVSRGEVI